MLALDAATVLMQWAVGSLFFLWITTRRREVGIGYGWMMRITFGLMALAALAIGLKWGDDVPVRDASAAGVVVATSVAMWVSVQRRGAGVSGQRQLAEARSARVAAMTGIEREVADKDESIAEFPPNLDLVAPVIGLVGLIAAGIAAGDPVALSLFRTLIGAAFLGAITDAMLLGHWYLVQPGLSRAPLWELVRWTGWLWPFHVVAFLLPTGMLSALRGEIEDGYNGLLVWFWAACVVTTIGLVIVTRLALRERQYSAVMAATGLLYLGILTAFGQDLVARAILAP